MRGNPYQASSEEAEITKNKILNKVSQEDIFRYYLGIEPVIGKKFCAPVVLRHDKHPTCTFKWFRGKLLYRDWRESRPCDCFLIVQRLNSCDFGSALKIIAKDFGIANVNGIKKTITPLYNLRTPVQDESKTTSRLRVKRQGFTSTDAEYLKTHGITKHTCELFRCSSLERLWLNGRLVYQYDHRDPALLYHFGGYNYKIYFYQRHHGRFICNTTRIQGYYQLPNNGDFLVITKSLKDVMVLYEAGYNSIAPQSENQFIDDETMEKLEKRFKEIVTLFDFDHTGVMSANYYKRRFGIEPLFFTDGRFGTRDYGAKDPAEYVKKHSLKKFKEIINETETR